MELLLKIKMRMPDDFYSTVCLPIMTISLHLLMTNMPLVNLFLAKHRSVGFLWLRKFCSKTANLSWISSTFPLSTRSNMSGQKRIKRDKRINSVGSCVHSPIYWTECNHSDYLSYKLCRHVMYFRYLPVVTSCNIITYSSYVILTKMSVIISLYL